MILSVCMSPCTDVTIELDSLKIGRTNIVKNKTFSLGGKGLNVSFVLKNLGFETLRLYTDEEDNAVAVKLYEKIGIASSGRTVLFFAQLVDIH